MKEGEEEVSLGEVCVFQGGSQPPKSTFIYEPKSGYIRLIQIRDYKSDKHIVYVPKEQAKRFCNSNDIMIGRYGPPVFQILRGKEGAYNVALMKAIPDETRLTNDFLYHFLRSPKIQNYIIRLSSRAAGQSGLNKATIEPYPILLPPLSEQRRIVAILDEAFEGIDRAIANAKNNLANAREIYESYLNNVFTHKGTGWSEITLGESCQFFNGKAHEKDIDENGTYVVVNSKFISTEGGIIKRTNKQMFPLVTGDIVLVMSDVPKGKALAKCFIIQEDNKYSLNQRICCIKSNSFHTEYLYFQLNRHPFLLAFDNKGSQANLKKEDILSCPLTLPPLNEQILIADKLNDAKGYARELEATYQRKLSALAELKQSLLQKAFSGELASPDSIKKEAIA